jgi:hypothetical protein
VFGPTLKTLCLIVLALGLTTTIVAQTKVDPVHEIQLQNCGIKGKSWGGWLAVDKDACFFSCKSGRVASGNRS